MLKDCLQFTSVKVHDFSSTVSKYEELFFYCYYGNGKRNNFHKKLLNKRRLQYLLYNIILL